MKMLDSDQQTLLAGLLTNALRSARMESAGFGFPKDRIEVTSVYSGEAAGIRDGDVLHPDDYVRAITENYRQSWIVTPIERALTLLGFDVPAAATPQAMPARTRAEARITLTPAEIQSGSDRVKWAEGLIAQLPADHDGRNSWLLNYGRGDEAKARRLDRQAKAGRAIHFPGADDNAEPKRTTVAVGAGQVVDAEFFDPAVNVEPAKDVMLMNGSKLSGVVISHATKPHPHASVIAQWLLNRDMPFWLWNTREWTPLPTLDLVASCERVPTAHIAIGDKPTAPPRRMCTLAGVEFPAPETTAPANVATYYVANYIQPDSPYPHSWHGWDSEKHQLDARCVHLTKEAAAAHGWALRFATKQAIEAAK